MPLLAVLPLVDESPKVAPDPENAVTFELLAALRRPAVTLNPLLDDDGLLGSPTGASSINLRGSRQEQQTPKSANRLTCPGRVRLSNFQQRAFAKWLQFFRIKL